MLALCTKAEGQLDLMPPLVLALCFRKLYSATLVCVPFHKRKRPQSQGGGFALGI